MDPETRVWLERQLLMVITGWSPDVVSRLSREERRTTLVFRRRWQEFQHKQTRK